MTVEKEPGRLVEEASRGETRAVDALLARYLPGLRGYLRNRAGPLVLDRESSSDLTQSVCREVLEHLETGRFCYRGEAEFKQWLYQAALFKVQDRKRFYLAQQRDAGREVAAPGDCSRSGDARYAELFQSLSTPSREAVQKEEVEAAERAFERLPERQRQIIVLARIDGLSHREIAARLGITEGASRLQLSRALARLTTLVKQRQDPDRSQRDVDRNPDGKPRADV